MNISWYTLNAVTACNGDVEAERKEIGGRAINSSATHGVNLQRRNKGDMESGLKGKKKSFTVQLTARIPPLWQHSLVTCTDNLNHIWSDGDMIHKNKWAATTRTERSAGGGGGRGYLRLCSGLLTDILMVTFQKGTEHNDWNYRCVPFNQLRVFDIRRQRVCTRNQSSQPRVFARHQINRGGSK